MIALLSVSSWGSVSVPMHIDFGHERTVCIFPCSVKRCVTLRACDGKKFIFGTSVDRLPRSTALGARAGRAWPIHSTPHVLLRHCPPSVRTPPTASRDKAGSLAAAEEEESIRTSLTAQWRKSERQGRPLHHPFKTEWIRIRAVKYSSRVAGCHFSRLS